MHRDISVGNILGLIDRKPVSVTDVNQFLRRTEAIAWEGMNSLASNDPQKEALVENGEPLECSLKALYISDKCRAVWSDGDMAANMTGYFERPRNKSEISGTIEFMSTELRRSMGKDTPHIHTPLDDLYSVFYTMLWATFNNKGRLPDEEAKIGNELEWRQDLRSAKTSTRDGATVINRPLIQPIYWRGLEQRGPNFLAHKYVRVL
ncbi:hypothetical protein CYLTODRAFT_422207 [Cylindrobasidium torrendii FP15055 ss-10]|uniref:Fungal-type protein kinase domain-containing protein n=1 Tax=Cylindrobasidium torrendii FP15055 ss-10 TaxID=1314674 RepID=A0A0D7BB62_9AGAR|nr:hypothetical protein CYLTODRAFT_422207 [Cylindrobasidium torrendii FP15055 ss-10]